DLAGMPPVDRGHAQAAATIGRRGAGLPIDAAAAHARRGQIGAQPGGRARSDVAGSAAAVAVAEADVARGLAARGARADGVLAVERAAIVGAGPTVAHAAGITERATPGRVDGRAEVVHAVARA